MSSDSRLGVYFHPASTSWKVRVSASHPATDRTTYLFGLALPSPLSLVGPSSSKGRLPRFNHRGQVRILLDVVVQLGLDGGNNGPAAVPGVHKVLVERVIASFPAVQAFLAQKAHDIVGVLWGRAEEETGFGELEKSQQPWEAWRCGY